MEILHQPCCDERQIYFSIICQAIKSVKKAQKKALTDEVQCFFIIWFTALSGLLPDGVISSLAA
ncbi:hypothetical protein [Pectobacterium brasiliense]|uniref:hypothetical protein n=1 Tax=Pectobacterium brasiliense TaxID=180957 RepID=UPI00057C50A4|nr:hypothetical protein [Pectobacterium brasiliense]